MTWSPYYTGSGNRPQVPALPPPPPWRATTHRADTTPTGTNPPGTNALGPPDVRVPFEPPDGLVEAVNAALCLRRPLLLTGAPGTGKSSVARSVAAELQLGPLLHWHITSRSTLTDALYRYDALGRLDAARHGEDADVSRFIRLGPLGTALLPTPRPRALLIDEIDKSDIDLPSDLLDVLERGTFEVPELSRERQKIFSVRGADGSDEHPIEEGQVRCSEFPFIVLTSNGERDFPAPFLRRCIRFSMPTPTYETLTKIVRAHLGAAVTEIEDGLLQEFAGRLQKNGNIATDQLLNAIFLVTRQVAPTGEQRRRVVELLLQELTAP